MVHDTAAGTRGGRAPRAGGPVGRWLMRQMDKRHRRKGYQFMGMNLLFLTTTGRKSGQARQSPMAWFPDGDDAWLIVPSACGSVRSPDWLLNMAAQPGQVRVEMEGRKFRATPQQLEGAQRDEAWQRITAAQPRFAKYQAKTDRVLPVIRLVPAEAGGHGPLTRSG